MFNGSISNQTDFLPENKSPALRRAIDSAVADFLEQGGQINVIPRGVSGFDNRMERLKAEYRRGWVRGTLVDKREARKAVIMEDFIKLGKTNVDNQVLLDSVAGLTRLETLKIWAANNTELAAVLEKRGIHRLGRGGRRGD